MPDDITETEVVLEQAPDGYPWADWVGADEQRAAWVFDRMLASVSTSDWAKFQANWLAATAALKAIGDAPAAPQPAQEPEQPSGRVAHLKTVKD